MSPSGADPTAPSGQPDPQTSAQWDPDREPVEELAGEFVERRRRGERTTIEEYAQRYPNLAGEIRDLFPAVLAMEKLNHRAQDDLRPSHQNISVEQLGDFRVISEIARGGMGIVYEAEQVTLGRRVAVKVLPQMALRNERDVLRFHREARTSAKLHHTNIVPVFGVGEQDGLYYIVMQFIQGVGLDEIRSELRRLVLGGDESTEQPSTDRARSSYVKRNAAALLSEKMRRESSSDSGRELVDSTSRFAGTIDTDTTDGEPATDLDRGQDDEGDANEYLVRIDSEYWRNVARIGVQAASALHYAHAHGTLHRDVKPGNLLLDGEGVVWVADFGLAKAVEQDDVTWTGDIVGTLGYMAPERFHGDCDERSDLYGLGLTLYELLTFERAYEGPDRVALMHRVAHGELPLPRRQNPAIPRDLETIIMKAAAKNPDERYQSAADLAADLQNFLDDRPIRARRVHPLEQAIRWCRRNRAVASLATTVALLLALISLVASWGYVRESRQRYRAEATSQLAVDALERIYGQFAPNQLPLRVPEAPAEGDEDAESLLDVQTQLPLSRNVAELLDNLLEFYDQLSKQTEDQGVLLKSIMANRRVADIQFRLGQHEPARTSYERAIERAKSIDAVTEPITLELARIHNGLGTVLLAQRDRDSASESHHQALELLEPHGASLDAKYEIARTLFLLHQSKRRFWWFRRDRGNSDEKQDREENKQIIQRAVALLIELSGEHAEVPEYRFLLAKCYRAETARPVETAGSTSAKAVALLEELVRQRPDVADYRFELGDAYMESGFRRLRPGDETSTPEELAAAESRLRRALEVTSDIELTHPNIPQYLHQKTRLHHTLARILESQNQPEAASQQYGEAIQRQAWAVRRDPDDYHPRVWLAHLRLEWAQLLIDTQQTEVACEQLKMIPQILGDPETQQTDSRFVTRMAERVRTRTDEILDDIRTRRRGG